jgi:hypothetical protein
LKRIFQIFIVLLVGTNCSAQAVAYLTGTVYDIDNVIVSNAFVKVASTGKAEYSDIRGKYTIEVPANESILIQLAYSGATLKRTLGPFAVGKTYYQNFRFNASFSLRTAYVKAERDRGSTLLELDPIKIERFANAGGFEQQLKLIGLGISSAGGDQSSAYSVRGGNFDENLVYINDMEVYRPFLVRSGQQEGLSVINGSLVDNVKFSAGGFQARYGDKLSSVLDITYRQPDSFAASVEASFLGANVHVEDKSKNNRFSYLVGARYRSNQYLLGSLDVQGDYKPRFFDIQTLLKYRITTDLSLSYLTTLSQNRYLVTPQSRQTSFGNVNSALSLFIAFGGQELMEYTTWMNGLNLEYKPEGKRIELKLNASSYITSEREHFTIEGAYRLSELENNLGSDDFASEKALLGVGYFIDHARNDLQAKVFAINQKGKYALKTSSIQWGFGFTKENIIDKLKEWRYNDSSGYNITTRNQDNAGNEIILDEFLKADINLSSYRANAYIQNTQLLNKRNNLKATYGIRTNYWSYNKENVISPRVQFSWQPNKPFNDTLRITLMDSLQKANSKYNQDTLRTILEPRTKRDWLFRFAGGYYYQPPFYRELRGVDGVLNPNLKAQRSIHAVLGGDMNFEAWGRPFKFITEVYYKHQDRMVPYVIDNVRIRYLAENSAQGYATGIDARVNGEFIEGIESWFNFSLMQTQERIYYTNEVGEEVLSDWLRRPTDQRVNFSILFQDELPNNPSYKMNLGLVYGTNMPFYFDAANRQKPGFKIPAYRRVDIGFSKVLMDSKSEKRPKWLKSSESLWVSLEIFNLLQVNNTISYILVKDFSNTVYGVPNYLTGRRINLRFILKI